MLHPASAAGQCRCGTADLTQLPVVALHAGSNEAIARPDDSTSLKQLDQLA